jgi:hypothetical protein
MQEMSKGRKIRKIPETTVATKHTSPLTRSSVGKNSPYIQGKQATSERPPTSPTEGEKNIRWLNKQLREAQDQGRKENIRGRNHKKLQGMQTSHR